MRALLLVLATLAVARPQGGAGTPGEPSAPVSAVSSAAVPSSGTASASSAAAPDASDPAGNATVPEPSASSAAPAAESSASPTTSAECNFCTIPAGYTSEHWDAPLNVDDQFSPRFREAHAKAKAYLTGWTVEEKVHLVTGSGWMQDRCVGNIPAVPERNWTGLCLEDSPLGVRLADYVSAFPAAINAAST